MIAAGSVKYLQNNYVQIVVLFKNFQFKAKPNRSNSISQKVSLPAYCTATTYFSFQHKLKEFTERQELACKMEAY